MSTLQEIEIDDLKEELERLREAICIYMREEGSQMSYGEEGEADQMAIDWFCDQYSERNYE